VSGAGQAAEDGRTFWAAMAIMKFSVRDAFMSL
jgi:hypothetical protein